MFICELTKKQTMPGQKAYKLVIQTREKEYKDNQGYVIGHGFETVKELTVCEEAYIKAKGGK